ncbi:MAG TPA: glycosyltransferase family 2 protein [Candidatus Dormibacteraeota bacterium]|nr:glycosyltransferase family 2 protein [Candidatus Dormibacteraeota bacterium]
MLARDEERNLPRALTSLPRGMQVLVIDARSRDRTVEFARAAGAQVIERDWTGFLDTRRIAASNVATPWTFMIDADEALDDALRDAILCADGDVDGYIVRRSTYYCGKALRMWKNEPLVRLFRTGRALLKGSCAAGGSAQVHERWVCEGPVAELRGTLLHYSYADAASYRAKFERYTDLEAAALHASPLRTAQEWLLVWPRWLRLLLLKGALLDGGRGIAAAYWSARYRYVACRKAR